MILPESALEEITEDEIESELPLLKEYGVDFATGQMTGKIVDGIEAIKVWLWLLFNTDRYNYMIYDFDYGNELHELLNDEDASDPDYLQGMAEENIEDALSINEYITGCECDISKTDDVLNINLSVSTVYGELEVSYDV